MNRRGLGSVYKRGEIYWISYFYNGKQYRESSRSRKEQQANALLKRRLGEIGRGKLIGPTEEKLSFETLVADVVADYRVNGKRSLPSALGSIKHLRRFFGMSTARAITADGVRRYARQRQEEGAANGSINRELALLKRAFNLAVETERLSFAPHIPMLAEAMPRQGFLRLRDFLALRAELPEYLHDLASFLYFSGWRRNEARTLEWRDVDLAGNVIRLRPERSKNGKGRVLPLSGELLDVIKRAHERRRLVCRFVFHKDGRPIGDFRKSWSAACKRAGLGGTLVHDMRRSAVRNLIRSGVTENVAMAITGHRTRSVFDRYDIVAEEDLQRATERLHAHLVGQLETGSLGADGATIRYTRTAS